MTLKSSMTDADVFQQIHDTVLLFSKAILEPYFAHVGVNTMDSFMQIDESDFDLPYQDVKVDPSKDLYLQLINT